MIYKTAIPSKKIHMLNRAPGKFLFNASLDVAFLEELFEGDTAYAVTVFGEFIKDLPLFWSEVETAHRAQDVPAMRAAAHKCKTLFGYVGCTTVQEAFQQFEHLCGKAKGAAELEGDYHLLAGQKEAASGLILSEYNRLKQYHES